MALPTEVQIKARAAEALKLRDKLTARAAVARKNPALWKRYQSVMGSFGASVTDWVQKVTGVYDSAKGAFVKLYQLVLGDSGGLGSPALVVGGAALVGALTAMTAWVTKAYELDRRMDAYEAGLKAGLSPKDAANSSAQAAGDGSSQNKSTGDQIKDSVGAVTKGAVVLSALGLGWKFRDEIASIFKRKNGRKG